jgi:hypothetical protein
MVATRWLMTIGVVAIAGGAMLAFATVPAFAPYRSVKPDRTATAVASPDDFAAAAPETTYGLTPPMTQEQVAPEMADGAAVAQPPRWAEDRDELFALGRRAWRDWVEPGEEMAWEGPDDRGYAPGRRRDRDDDAYGYAPERDLPRRDWRDDESYDEPLAPAEAPRSYADARPWSRDAGARRPSDDSDMPDDAAADAAERARAAARDVRAAQGVQ